MYFQRNRFNVPTRHVNALLSPRAYPDTLVLLADGVEVARHTRSFERDLRSFRALNPVRGRRAVNGATAFRKSSKLKGEIP